MPYGKGTYGSKVGRPKKKKTLGRGVAKTVGRAAAKTKKKGKGFAKKTFIIESAKSKAKKAKKIQKPALPKRKPSQKKGPRRVKPLSKRKKR